MSRVRVFAFAGDHALLPANHDSVWTPGGGLGLGEDWVNAALREAREELGVRLLSLHPLGLIHQSAPGRIAYFQVLAWAEAERAGEPSNPPDGELVTEVLELPAAEAAIRLEAGPHADFADALLAADSLRRAGVDDETWFRDHTRLLERFYLAQTDLALQSGKLGGLEDWELSRRVIARAIPRSGDFLDVGCANGLLMESVRAWCNGDGKVIEPHGLDISDRLVELARRRLPQWAGRIWAGNAWNWEPPRRFDFVHTRLDHVPERLRGEFVARQLERLVRPGGMLLVTPLDAGPADNLRAWGFRVGGELVQERPGRAPARVAWIDKPG